LKRLKGELETLRESLGLFKVSAGVVVRPPDSDLGKLLRLFYQFVRSLEQLPAPLHRGQGLADHPPQFRPIFLRNAHLLAAAIRERGHSLRILQSGKDCSPAIFASGVARYDPSRFREGSRSHPVAKNATRVGQPPNVPNQSCRLTSKLEWTIRELIVNLVDAGDGVLT
jgi:hypothetical protein